MGFDPRIMYMVVAELIVQMGVTWYVSVFNPGWITFWLLVYFVGATLNHSLAAALHEIGHNLAFGHRYGKLNRILSIAANLPIVLPVAISYRKYHQEHHR